MATSLNTSEPPEDIRFYNNFEALCVFAADELEALQKKGVKCLDPRLIDVYLGMNDNQKETLMQQFIVGSHIYWDMIHKKAEEFFIDNADGIFADIPMAELNVFKTMIDEGLDADKKDFIWRKLHAMIKISIKYVIKKRWIPDGFNLDHHRGIWKI